MRDHDEGYDDVFSPYARKVRIALYEKGVPFERVRALHGDFNQTDFLHVRMPHGREQEGRRA